MTRLVYITSPSYSGSTLLTLLLGAHPSVGTVGEMKARARGDIDAYRCSCGALIRECGFWRRACEAMARRGTPFDVVDMGLDFTVPGGGFAGRVVRAGVRGPSFELARRVFVRSWPGCHARMRETLRRNEVFVDVLCELFGCDVIVDGSKDPIRLSYLCQSDTLDVRVIHLVRDGRGVSNSYRRHDNFSVAVGGAEFVRSHQEAERVLSSLPEDRVLRLGYESLCEFPEERMGEVYDFVGVDTKLAPTDFSGYEHHVIGNSMRLLKLSEIRCDDKWRRDLSEEDLRAFECVAGETNRAFGYV